MAWPSDGAGSMTECEANVARLWVVRAAPADGTQVITGGRWQESTCLYPEARILVTGARHE